MYIPECLQRVWPFYSLTTSCLRISPLTLGAAAKAECQQFFKRKQQSALSFHKVEKDERVTTHTLGKRGQERETSFTPASRRGFSACSRHTFRFLKLLDFPLFGDLILCTWLLFNPSNLAGWLITRFPVPDKLQEHIFLQCWSLFLMAQTQAYITFTSVVFFLSLCCVTSTDWTDSVAICRKQSACFIDSPTLRLLTRCLICPRSFIDIITRWWQGSRLFDRCTLS